MEKICFKCGAQKDLSEFYKHKQMADGHLNKCKSCARRDAGSHREKNIKAIREYDRARAKNPERVKKAAAITARWRQADSRRMRAHNMVTRAVRAGKLDVKRCEWPGCTEEKTYAHHESYDHPLTVIFYCQPHHKQRHKEMVLEGIEP